MPGAVELTVLELAVGLPLGADTEEVFGPHPDEAGARGAAGEPAHDPNRYAQPLEALENALAPALSAPPVVVTFSGGRDASLVLAAAVRAAHRYRPPISERLAGIGNRAVLVIGSLPACNRIFAVLDAEVEVLAADSIVVLERGRIVKNGTHADLAADLDPLTQCGLVVVTHERRQSPTRK